MKMNFRKNLNLSKKEIPELALTNLHNNHNNNKIQKDNYKFKKR